MLRFDKRAPNEMRQIQIVKGLCRGSQGSSRVSIGNTQVIVNIVGPRECKIHDIDTGKVQLKVRSYPETNNINQIVADAVNNSLDLTAYPDSLLEISITIAGNEGSLSCCAINATILALIDSGLQMKRLTCAISFALKDEKIWLDPTDREEIVGDGHVTFLVEKESRTVFGTYFQGHARPEMIQAALTNATLNGDDSPAGIWFSYF